MPDSNDVLQSVITDYILDGFIDSYIEQTDPKELQLEALGCVISKYCEWSGNSILSVAIHALEDANFRPEAEQLQKILRKIETE